MTDTKQGYCKKSPTKAHHWIFGPQGSEDAYNAKCKYCGEERAFNHPSPYDSFVRTSKDIHRQAMESSIVGNPIGDPECRGGWDYEGYD